mgnify:CR=1 FL=1
MELSVVVPILNEQENIRELHKRLSKTLNTLTEAYEIIAIDDGSTDGSSALLDKISQHAPNVRVLHFDRNHGQTAALDAGFRHAKGELIATLDGDLQYDPTDITKLLPLTKEYDLV